MEPLHSTDPEAVGPYRLIARLGAGGMGQVHLARSAGGRTVAVKVVRPELAQDHEFRVRFRREVAAARAVDGAYTAPVTDADPDGPTPWLATAYVLGPSLTEAVHEHGPLPEPSVRALGARLAEALEAIHGAGLVHRDLKPSNVLLAADGPRVIDFGIARAMDGDSMTQTGIVVGSPGFMSPEQASGRPTGAPGDVFSLASVLVFAATGHGPFDSASGVAAQLYKVVHEEPDLTDVPPALRAILEHCLRKDPALRPLPAHLRAWLATGAPATEWLPAPVAAALARHAAAVMNLEAPLRTPAPPAVPHVPYGPAPTYVPTQLNAPTPPRPSRRRFLLAGGALAATAAVGGTTWALTRPDKPGGGTPGGSTPGGSPSVGPSLPAAPKPAWTMATEGKYSGLRPPLVVGDRVVLRADDTFGVDANLGVTAWQHTSSASYLVGGGDLYEASAKLERIAPEDGSASYAASTDLGGGRTVEINALLAATEQAVFATVRTGSGGAATDTPGLVAFKHDLSSRLWYQEDREVGGDPYAALQDHVGVVSGTTLLHLDNKFAVVARSTVDGKRLWRVETGSKASWPVWCDDQRAYCAVDGYHLQAVNLADGKQVWRLDSEHGRIGKLLVAGGTVYLNDGSQSITACDAATGKPRWTCATPGYPNWNVDMVLVKSTLYVAGSTTPGEAGKPCVHAIDITTGRLRWIFTDPTYQPGTADERTLESCQLAANGTFLFVWLKKTLTALPVA
ncbi:PQQ-binding-like beta-propeller repeat protein [Kitasatospora sp. NPDC018058]|uniref:protein kinase domain-containing protein n=1 Tax=Kitasatospora sp. NPDC018058 TaxID=3364025 RepID=UPI0037C110DA